MFIIIIMNYHFEINKSNYSDMWSCPVHSLNCVLNKMYSYIKFEVVYVTVNVNIVVLSDDVLWHTSAWEEPVVLISAPHPP